MPAEHQHATHIKIPYRADIDGLRAVAVLGVLFYHAGLGFPGGYVGVDVFFVISGFLITSLILKDLQLDRFSLAEFWERRVRRILPPLVVVMLATVALGWWLMIPADYQSLGSMLMSVVGMVANIFLWRVAGDYFGPNVGENPALHTWSLAVEEQFYLFLPILLLALAHLRGLRWLMPLFLVAALFSLILSIVGIYIAPTPTFFLLPTRIWELVAGSLLALLMTSGKLPTVSSFWREAASISGLLLIVSPYFLYHKGISFPGLSAMPPVLGTSLIIWAGLGCQTDRLPWINRILTWRPIVFIGLISYSLYLWHWPLLVFARYASFAELSLAMRWGLVVASFVLAILTWLLVETPFRRKQIFASRRSIFTSGAIAYALLLALGLGIYLTSGLPSRYSPAAIRLANAAVPNDRYLHEYEPGDVGQNLTKLGLQNTAPSLLVWGDSHAMSMLPAVDQLFQQTGRSALAVTRSATAPVLNWSSHAGRRDIERSFHLSQAVLSFLDQSDIKQVLLVAQWENYFNYNSETFAQALIDTVTALQQRGMTVYVLRQVPDYPQSIPRFMCFFEDQQRDFKELTTDTQAYQQATLLQDAMFQKLQQLGVVVIDPEPAFTREDHHTLWPFSPENIPYYRDSNHLTDLGAQQLIPILDKAFEPHLFKNTNVVNSQETTEGSEPSE